jgi:glutathione synthase/RimK-type ligase-like ATP-grasp enzyme
MNLADTLNLGCPCRTLDEERLDGALEAAGLPAAGGLRQTHPHLFSASPVFMSTRDLAAVQHAVAALEAATHDPAYREAALARASAIARLDFGPTGAFMGYDFHLTPEGPRLIEINTNAGGAFLHAAAVRAHRACCRPWDRIFSSPLPPDDIEQAFFDMFLAEWRSQRGDQPLQRVAIVDTDPAAQYLAPEFELARAFFMRRGIGAVIADPKDLALAGGVLTAHGRPVELVYNRLTDFQFAEPSHAALRDAYAAGVCVVTPSPRAHALHADKRNLVEMAAMPSLAGIVPATERVAAENADALWARRRELFFKPDAGFGSRGAYRGDKLTRRVWSEIVQGGYIAQQFVAPSERRIDVGGQPVSLKMDVRAYAFRGRVLQLAARTYAGQTTNFRTEGGGFSPVVVLPDLDSPQCGC